jgi:hypothetical protein
MKHLKILLVLSLCLTVISVPSLGFANKPEGKAVFQGFLYDSAMESLGDSEMTVHSIVHDGTKTNVIGSLTMDKMSYSLEVTLGNNVEYGWVEGIGTISKNHLNIPIDVKAKKNLNLLYSTHDTSSLFIQYLQRYNYNCKWKLLLEY